MGVDWSAAIVSGIIGLFALVVSGLTRLAIRHYEERLMRVEAKTDDNAKLINETADKDRQATNDRLIEIGKEINKVRELMPQNYAAKEDIRDLKSDFNTRFEDLKELVNEKFDGLRKDINNRKERE